MSLGPSCRPPTRKLTTVLPASRVELRENLLLSVDPARVDPGQVVQVLQDDQGNFAVWTTHPEPRLIGVHDDGIGLAADCHR